MKKPLTLVPPAQAEALYDAALLPSPRGPSTPAVPCPRWDLLEWGEDDAPLERASTPRRDYTESPTLRRH